MIIVLLSCFMSVYFFALSLRVLVVSLLQLPFPSGLGINAAASAGDYPETGWFRAEADLIYPKPFFVKGGFEAFAPYSFYLRFYLGVHRFV